MKKSGKTPPTTGRACVLGASPYFRRNLFPSDKTLPIAHNPGEDYVGGINDNQSRCPNRTQTAFLVKDTGTLILD